MAIQSSMVQRCVPSAVNTVHIWPSPNATRKKKDWSHKPNLWEKSSVVFNPTGHFHMTPDTGRQPCPQKHTAYAPLQKHTACSPLQEHVVHALLQKHTACAPLQEHVACAPLQEHTALRAHQQLPVRGQVQGQHCHHFRACFPVSFSSLVTSLFTQSGTCASENCQACKKCSLKGHQK